MKKTIYSIFALGFVMSTIAISCNAEDRNSIETNIESKEILSKEAVKNASLAKQLQYKKH